MDGEVPEYLAAGASARALDDYYLTNELLGLLHHGDAGAGSSVVDGNPSLDSLLPPPSSPVPACYTAAGASSARAVPSEAEMASWLCQVFEQREASDPPIAATTTTKSEGESTIRGSGSSGGGGPSRTASAGTPGDERPRSSRRRRSSSGKAAEQRRRDRINDKMKTLQQLMPRCAKTDKASTLEEVIQYVRSLQYQLQMLSGSGSAMPPAPILPAGVVPPLCMQLAAGNILGAGGQAPAAPLMLPPYPLVPAVFACPHHGHGVPPPQPYHYPAGSGSATQQQLAQRRDSNDLSPCRATGKQVQLAGDACACFPGSRRSQK